MFGSLKNAVKTRDRLSGSRRRIIWEPGQAVKKIFQWRMFGIFVSDGRNCTSVETNDPTSLHSLFLSGSVCLIVLHDFLVGLSCAWFLLLPNSVPSDVFTSWAHSACASLNLFWISVALEGRLRFFRGRFFSCKAFLFLFCYSLLFHWNSLLLGKKIGFFCWNIQSEMVIDPR